MKATYQAALLIATALFSNDSALSACIMQPPDVDQMREKLRSTDFASGLQSMETIAALPGGKECVVELSGPLAYVWFKAPPFRNRVEVLLIAANVLLTKSAPADKQPAPPNLGTGAGTFQALWFLQSSQQAPDATIAPKLEWGAKWFVRGVPYLRQDEIKLLPRYEDVIVRTFHRDALLTYTRLHEARARPVVDKLWDISQQERNVAAYGHIPFIFPAGIEKIMEEASKLAEVQRLSDGGKPSPALIRAVHPHWDKVRAIPELHARLTKLYNEIIIRHINSHKGEAYQGKNTVLHECPDAFLLFEAAKVLGKDAAPSLPAYRAFVSRPNRVKPPQCWEESAEKAIKLIE